MIVSADPGQSRWGLSHQKCGRTPLTRSFPRVKYLNLDRTPYPCLELPGEFTKNGEDARLLLVPVLAEELRELVAGKGPDARVFDVPEKMVPVMKRDLKHAGIAYRDDRGRYADFHSLRKSAGTMLGVAGVPTRIRQLFMRHGDVRLTLQTYDDADFSSTGGGPAGRWRSSGCGETTSR